MPTPPLLTSARHRFGALPAAAKAGLVAAVLVPVFAFAALGGGGGEEDGPKRTGAPATAGDTFLASASAVLAHDLDDELERLRDAGPAVPAAVDPAYAAKAIALMQSLPKDADGNPDWARVDMEDYRRRVEALGDPSAAGTGTAPPLDIEDLDLDDALDAIAERIDAENPDTLDELRSAPQADDPAALAAHASVLMLSGDPWGAAANLLVAHAADEDDASPLVALAAIANGQNLPSVALALLAGAEAREMLADDSPAGIAEQAALLNNRGHALLLLRRYDEAEAPLRAALATSPELSEAARNLAHALLKLGRDDEARALMPRAVWRVRGDPSRPVPVRETGEAPPPSPVPPPAGDPASIARWVRAPWLESHHGSTRPPLWIALDLSKQGQVAWPEPLYPVADATYGSWFERASSRYVAAHRQAAVFGDVAGAQVTAGVSRRMTRADHVHQAIEVLISPLWMLEPIDREMHRLDSPGKESLILSTNQPTRFAALDVAREEFRMELAADRLYQRFRRDSRCPAGALPEECCAISRREIDRNLAEMTPIAREYEEQMRVFFREAYGLSTAIASNLPPGRWHSAARSTIEQQVQLAHWRTQQEIAFAFAHAAPAGSACYDDVDVAEESAPDVAVDAPACSAAAQWASGKYSFSDNFSMELTCGKLKFVAEVNVIGTKKLNWGPLTDVGADLGMHAEVEFTMEGTMTIFAGPKAGIAGKIGGAGGDFGVKDGIYAVIGADGVRDVGMRVVIGGGVGAGQFGGTHDVDSMDFSFVSAI